MKQVCIFLLVFSINTSTVFCQTDFSQYSTLQSNGAMPDDFKEATFRKVEKELESEDIELDDQKSKVEFLEKTRYAIDDLLHSGDVVYGDKVSNYVSSIADRLLADNAGLRSELRFYTLKMNETNAFSTDQGIIFVTTGLLSRLKNEAQLAYILSHEIAHYTEKHVIETFVWKKNQRKWKNWVGRMSVYSKSKELEADRLAIDMYRNAGYSKDELLSTFKLLLYSYLPFSQTPIEIDYFRTDRLYIPNSLFPDSTFEIKANAFESDSLSSHPNVARRKYAVMDRMDEIEGSWGEFVNFHGEELFNEIRNIARFETVRTDVMEANFGKALYSIYLLERDFSESFFLDRMKLLSWLGLYQYKSCSKIELTVLPDNDLEGESADVHYFLKKLNRKSLTTLSMRYIYDIRKKYFNNSEIQVASSYFFHLLRNDEEFKLSNYSTESFSTYPDSVKKESIDSLNFYSYALSDILTDSTFIKEFNNLEPTKQVSGHIKIEEKQRRRDRYSSYNELKIGSKKLIVVEPRIFDYNRHGRKYVKSEKLESIFSECIESSGELAGVETHQINKRNITTESYNSRSILFGFLSQLIQEQGVQPFPVDYKSINNISQNYGTSDVMFMVVDHTYKPSMNPAVLFLSVITYYTLPVYLPLKLFSGNQTNLTVLIMDINTGKLKTGSVFRFHESLRKHNIGSRMFNLFMHVKTPPVSDNE